MGVSVRWFDCESMPRVSLAGCLEFSKFHVPINLPCFHGFKISYVIALSGVTSKLCSFVTGKLSNEQQSLSSDHQ